jgi:hypothetical protein
MWQNISICCVWCSLDLTVHTCFDSVTTGRPTDWHTRSVSRVNIPDTEACCWTPYSVPSIHLPSSQFIFLRYVSMLTSYFLPALPVMAFQRVFERNSAVDVFLWVVTKCGLVGGYQLGISMTRWEDNIKMVSKNKIEYNDADWICLVRKKRRAFMKAKISFQIPQNVWNVLTNKTAVRVSRSLLHGISQWIFEILATLVGVDCKKSEMQNILCHTNVTCQSCVGTRYKCIVDLQGLLYYASGGCFQLFLTY